MDNRGAAKPQKLLLLRAASRTTSLHSLQGAKNGVDFPLRTSLQKFSRLQIHIPQHLARRLLSRAAKHSHRVRFARLEIKPHELQ